MLNLILYSLSPLLCFTHTPSLNADFLFLNCVCVCVCEQNVHVSGTNRPPVAGVKGVSEASIVGDESNSSSARSTSALNC